MGDSPSDSWLCSPNACSHLFPYLSSRTILMADSWQPPVILMAYWVTETAGKPTGAFENISLI